MAVEATADHLVVPRVATAPRPSPLEAMVVLREAPAPRLSRLVATAPRPSPLEAMVVLQEALAPRLSRLEATAPRLSRLVDTAPRPSRLEAMVVLREAPAPRLNHLVATADHHLLEASVLLRHPLEVTARDLRLRHQAASGAALRPAVATESSWQFSCSE